MHRKAVLAHMMKNISDIHPVKIFVHKFFPLIFYILHFTFYLILSLYSAFSKSGNDIFLPDTENDHGWEQ